MASPPVYARAPPSPATAAAALSLGALAAAAAIEPRPTLAKAIAPAPLPSLPNMAVHQQLPPPATLAPPMRTVSKPKQKRYRANPDQLRELIAVFNANPSPTASELTQLSVRIAMPTQSVVLWFKNRRARVPHKKAEKAEAAKRREEAAMAALTLASASAGNPDSNSSSFPSSDLKNSKSHDPHVPSSMKAILTPVKGSSPTPASFASNHDPDPSSSAGAAAAALVMAEMAYSRTMDDTASGRFIGSNTFVPPTHALNYATAATSDVAPRKVAFPSQASECAQSAVPNQRRFSGDSSRFPNSNKATRESSTTSSSPLAPARSASVNTNPVHTQKDMKLDLPEYRGNGVRLGDFVLPTPRRPRVLPLTPRIRSQLEYQSGDKVEVLDTTKGICRLWYPGTIVRRESDLKELRLGANAATLTVSGMVSEPSLSTSSRKTSRSTGQSTKESDSTENDTSDEGQDELENTSDGESPRTVRSPAASPTPAVAKKHYLVRFDYRYEDLGEKKQLVEDVIASRIRPQAPALKYSNDWKPEIGEAVEALQEGAWSVGVLQAHALRKGFLVSFENGETRWIKRDELRAYQIWRGRGEWVVKTKAPLPVVRKGVGLSVTHPPGGKRKWTDELSPSNSEGAVTNSDGRRRRSNRTKRARSFCVDSSGPDGLPEGWTIDPVSRGSNQGSSRREHVYVAPDGHRLRSLKEAQRYVRLMGPA